MFYYIDATTKRFALVADLKKSDPNLIEVPSPPPNGNYRWGTGDWEELTEAQIQSTEDETAVPGSAILASEITTKNAIAVWGDSQGSSLLSVPTVRTEDYFKLTIDGEINSQEYYLRGNFLNLEPFTLGAAEGDIAVFRGGAWIREKLRRTWCWAFAYNKNSVKDEFLARQGDVHSDRCPYIAPCDCRIYRLTAESYDEDDFELKIYKNGSLLQAFTKPQNTRNFQFATNLQLVSGDRISAKVERIGGGSVTDPGCCLYLEES